MLCDRIISACVLIPIVVSILLCSSYIQFSIFLIILCVISAWEWGKLMCFSLNTFYIWICLIFVILCIMMMIIHQKIFDFKNWYIIVVGICSIFILWWIVICLLTLVYPHYVDFWRKSNIVRFCFGMLIIIPFFLGSLILHQFHHININISGKWWLLYILVIVWINDISAYFFGRLLGTHQLLKNVSPNKTWEGCIVGFLMSGGISWLLSKYFIIGIENFYVIFFSFIGVIFFAIMGDLIESMFKREAKIKDINNLIPGHGGLLDRIDSLIISIPVFVVLLLFDNLIY